MRISPRQYVAPIGSMSQSYASERFIGVPRRRTHCFPSGLSKSYKQCLVSP